MTDEKEKDEDCSVCKIAVSLGMALSICKQLDSKKECDELFEKVTKEDISPKELFDIIKQKAKDKPEQLDLINYIEELAGGLEEDEP